MDQLELQAFIFRNKKLIRNINQDNGSLSKKRKFPGKFGFREHFGKKLTNDFTQVKILAKTHSFPVKIAPILPVIKYI
jgi:hypothetical protein